MANELHVIGPTSNLRGGTIAGATLTNVTINTSTLTGGLVSAATINNATVGTSTLTGGAIVSAALNNATISTSTMNGGLVNNAAISTSTVTGGVLDKASITTSTLTAPGMGTGGFGGATKYVSSAQTITAGGALTLAHGLGITPTNITALLTMTATGTDAGYVTNDAVYYNIAPQSDSAADAKGMSVTVDSTNIGVRFGSGATNSLAINNKATGATTALTNANWTLTFKAWSL